MATIDSNPENYECCMKDGCSNKATFIEFDNVGWYDFIFCSECKTDKSVPIVDHTEVEA